MSWEASTDKWMILKDIKNMDGKKVKWVLRLFQNNISGEVKFFDADYVDSRGTQSILDELNKTPEATEEEEPEADATLKEVLKATL